jgi:S1-C subfamily serine protease
VPVDTINRVVPRVIAYGDYVRPTLGISIDDRVSRRLVGREAINGVLVLEVSEGSPAARAGLRATQISASGRVTLGDVIEAVDERQVQSSAELINALDAREFGDSVMLRVRRGSQRLEVPIVLEAASGARAR